MEPVEQRPKKLKKVVAFLTGFIVACVAHYPINILFLYIILLILDRFNVQNGLFVQRLLASIFSIALSVYIGIWVYRYSIKKLF